MATSYITDNDTIEIVNLETYEEILNDKDSNLILKH